MTKSTTKLFLKKVLAWLKVYWYVPLIFVVGIVIFIMTGGKNKILLKLIEKKDSLYKKESAEIERIHDKKVKDVERAHGKYVKDVKDITDQYKRNVGELDKKKKAMIEKMVKDHKDDRDTLAETISKEFGFELVKGDDQ